MTHTLRRKLSLTAAGIGVALMSLAYSTGMASATSNTQTVISIPVSTVVRNVGVGQTKELATKQINDKYVGMECRVVAGAENQSSVHPGNDLVVASGNNSVTLQDVERAANVSTEADGTLTLGNVVTVSLVMGEDNVFSAGMDVHLKCNDVPEIEVCRDGEIVTIKENKRLETDTDTCKEIQVCRGGEIITITEDKKLETDTNKCDEINVCRDGEIVAITEDQKRDTDTAKCKDVQICRDGEEITVTEDKVLSTDTEGDCPQTLGTQTELPNTGAGAFATIAMTLTTTAAGAYGAIKSRR